MYDLHVILDFIVRFLFLFKRIFYSCKKTEEELTEEPKAGDTFKVPVKDGYYTRSKKKKAEGNWNTEAVHKSCSD